MPGCRGRSVPGAGGRGLGAAPGDGAAWGARFGVWAAQHDTFWGRLSLFGEKRAKVARKSGNEILEAGPPRDWRNGSERNGGAVLPD